MWMLEKEKVMELSKIILDDNYTDWVNYLRGVLKLSRSPKIFDPGVLFLVQKKLIEATIKAQEAVRQGEYLLKKASTDKKIENIEGVKRQLKINRMIPHIMRCIADGIAWRILDFDKPFLRMMSEPKKYPGSVDFTDFSRVAINVAERTVKQRGAIILINDLTNFLRVGDLTEKGKITVISEIKYKKKKLVVKNVYEAIKANKKDLSSQELKIHQVQIARDFRKVVMPDGKEIPITDIPIDFKNNFDTLNDLIKYARKDGVSSREIGKYLFIEVNDFETLFRENKEKSIDLIKGISKPSWLKNENTLVFSNFDSFFNKLGDFPRALTPFSVFPLTDYNCMNLISGKTLSICYLNLDEIKKIIRNDGWTLKEFDLEKSALENKDISLKRFEKGLIYQTTLWEDMYEVKKGPCTIIIPVVSISAIATEFMAPQTLLDLLNYIYTKNDHSMATQITFILGEKDVWK
jgi:hypothetical protein